MLSFNVWPRSLQMNLSKAIAPLTLLSVFTGIANAQTIQINRENKTIAISTTDEATATADIAVVTIGFEIYDANSESAYAQAARLSHAIMDALHKSGIDDKSIESDKQNLSRNTNFDEKDSAAERAKKQFRFEQSWDVTATPQTAAGLIRQAVAAGANTSGEIEWRLSDRKAIQARAAANALLKARAVASQMAEGLNVRLGGLIYASNVSPNGRTYVGTSAETVQVTADAPPPPPPLEIRPQTIREEATVYAVFAIE
jgi:uncharacterized protein YggE